MPRSPRPDVYVALTSPGLAISSTSLAGVGGWAVVVRSGGSFPLASFLLVVILKAITCVGFVLKLSLGFRVGIVLPVVCIMLIPD